MTAILSVRMEENAMTVMENYQAWLAMAADEPALMSELEAVRDQPEGIEDRFYTELSSAPPACAACLARAPTA